jgi:hypothetical protein
MNTAAVFISLHLSSCHATWLRYVIRQLIRKAIMGKYISGWLLGIPAIVLVIFYFFMH